MTKNSEKFDEIVKETSKCKGSKDLYYKLMEYRFTYIEENYDSDY